MVGGFVHLIGSPSPCWSWIDMERKYSTTEVGIQPERTIWVLQERPYGSGDVWFGLQLKAWISLCWASVSKTRAGHSFVLFSDNWYRFFLGLQCRQSKHPCASNVITAYPVKSIVKRLVDGYLCFLMLRAQKIVETISDDINFCNINVFYGL